MENKSKPINYAEIIENDEDDIRLSMIDDDDSEEIAYTPSIGFIRTVDADGNVSYIQYQSLMYDEHLERIRNNPSLPSEDESTDEV